MTRRTLGYNSENAGQVPPLTDSCWKDAYDCYSRALELPEAERRIFVLNTVADPEVRNVVFSLLDEAEEEHPAEESAPDPVLQPGTRAGRYEITGTLGRGGMGHVYSARDTELDRVVALKFVASGGLASPAAGERLINEAKAASALNHPNIVTVYDVARLGGELAIAMELVEGTALRSYCSAAQSISQVTAWGRQAARALAAAHERGIIHRDIKPENLMVRPDGLVKVLDFGLARHTSSGPAAASTRSGILAGTLEYMSPEQTRGLRVTAATDIFSLGAVLSELATGKHPFQAGSPIDTAHAIANREPLPASELNPNVSPALEQLLREMLDKDPAKRPAASAVEERLAGLETEPPAARPSRRLKQGLALAMAALLGVAAIVWLRVLPAGRTSPLRAIEQITRISGEGGGVIAAAVSADGRQLAYATANGPIHVRPARDGASRPLPTTAGIRASRITWFADGSKLAITGTMKGEARSSIWVAPVNGEPSSLVVPEGIEGVPSPDGKQLALLSADAVVIWVAGADGSNPRPLRNAGEKSTYSSLVWSPDGKRLAYQRREYAPKLGERDSPRQREANANFRFIYESLDVATRQVVASQPDFAMSSAAMLADGRIVFVRWPDPGMPLEKVVWEARTDPRTGAISGDARVVGPAAPYQLSQVSASADGSLIAVVRSTDLLNIFVAGLSVADGRASLVNPQRITFAESLDFPHAWTPDGQSMIFESNRNGTYDLYRQRVDRREGELMAGSPGEDVLAQVSADQKWILYRELTGPSGSLVMRLPIHGGPAERVFSGARTEEFRCALQPGRRCVLRSIEDEQFVFRELDPIRGRGAELARTAWAPFVVADWDISPDGSAVAIPNHDPRDARVRIVPLGATQAGRAEKVLNIDGLKNLNGVFWAASGDGLFVSTAADPGGVIYYVNMQGRYNTVLESSRPVYVTPSPDGKRVVFPDRVDSNNVWYLR
jgi:eukaryotic-like serine/threonine-protein kinase